MYPGPTHRTNRPLTSTAGFSSHRSRTKRRRSEYCLSSRPIILSTGADGGLQYSERPNVQTTRDERASRGRVLSCAACAGSAGEAGLRGGLGRVWCADVQVTLHARRMMAPRSGCGALWDVVAAAGRCWNSCGALRLPCTRLAFRRRTAAIATLLLHCLESAKAEPYCRKAEREASSRAHTWNADPDSAEACGSD
jgi:hypothetical protein